MKKNEDLIKDLQEKYPGLNILAPGTPESERFIARQRRKVAMPSQVRASRGMARQPAPASHRLTA